MIRASSVAVAVAALAAVGGCTTFSDNDAAARVGEVELSRDELEGVIAGVVAIDDSEAVTTTAENPRGAISDWIQTAVLDAALAANGEAVTEADVAQATSGLTTSIDPALWETLPEVLRQFLVERDATQFAAQRLQGFGDFDPAALDIEVDPRYGTWDAELSQVVALGRPQPTG